MAITTYGKVNYTRGIACEKENSAALGNYSFCATYFDSSS